jgi:hypothetical protein
MQADPSLPLGVGTGIDAGEAVAVAGGYRGGASTWPPGCARSPEWTVLLDQLWVP